MALNKISDHDYELEGHGCWIKAGNIMFLIVNTETASTVTAFRYGKEKDGYLKQIKVSQFERSQRE